MKLITYNPIAFLLNFLADNYHYYNIDGNSVINVNKNLSLLKIVALMCQQKSIDCSFSYEGFGFLNLKNKISNYILVGKDKSVVTNSKIMTPTVSILQ